MSFDFKRYQEAQRADRAEAEVTRLTAENAELLKDRATLENSIRRAEMDVDALHSKLAEAEQDTARLEFVMENRAGLWNTQLSDRNHVDAVIRARGEEANDSTAPDQTHEGSKG